MADKVTPPDPFAARLEALESHLAADDSAAMQALRGLGLRLYRAQGLPTPRLEAWKYTNLNALQKIAFATAGAAPQTLPDLPDSVLTADAWRFVLVNGCFDAGLSDLDGLPDGVEAHSLAESVDATADVLGKLLDLETQPLAALNTALFADGLVLRLADGVQLDRPLHLVSIGAAADEPVQLHPRVLVQLGQGARATLLESHVGLPGEAYFANPVAEVHLGRDAALAHLKLQAEAPQAFHTALTQVELQAGAQYDGFVLHAGGRLARNEVRTRLAGARADCRLHGVYLARDGQHVDNTTFIDHVVPDCHSRELYKGVLDDTARGAFWGKILVRKNAQRTDGHQLSRALLLSRGAEADVKPELEIYADDVRCSHGATVGELEADQLFYLRARGIDPETARALLIRAFVGEVVDRAPAAAQDALHQVVDAWLQEAGEQQGDND